MKKNRINESQEIKRLILIVLIVVALLVLVYFFTRIFITKDLKKDADTGNSTTINYDMTTVGLLLNRPYDEYYVYLYYQDDDNTNKTIQEYIDEYLKNDDALKLYYVNLNEKLNEKYYSSESNSDAKTISDFKFGNDTLLLIKEGKIVKYLENESTIKKELLKK